MISEIRHTSLALGAREASGLKALGISMVLAAALCPLSALAQAVDPGTAPPLSPAQSAKLNSKVAAAEASGANSSTQIVSETFTGNVIGAPDDRSIRIHRDDKNRDETVILYGISTFGSGPTGGKDAQSYLANHLKNAHVKIEGRGRSRDGILSALVTDMPPAGPVVATQVIDGSGANRDFPQHADAPNVASPPPTVNYALLRLGLARFDSRLLKDAPDLAGAEASARKEKKGYWADTTVAAAVTGTN